MGKNAHMGRGVKGKRVGSASTSKPLGAAPGFKGTTGKMGNQGGNTGRSNPGKGKNSKKKRGSGY